jgi:hypothetical protein
MPFLGVARGLLIEGDSGAGPPGTGGRRPRPATKGAGAGAGR